MKYSLQRCMAAEFIGTFFLVFIGVGSAIVASSDLGPLGISLAFTFVVASAVYAFGPISGAHINPAVTIGLWTRGALERERVPAYVAAQISGAVAGALLLGLIAGDSAVSGATVPQIPVPQAVAVEIVLSFALMTVILAVVDHGGARGAGALAIGLAVGMNSLMGGGLTGASMNPARSLGPAMVSGVWTDHWIYWIAPIAGMLLAAWVWMWLVDSD